MNVSSEGVVSPSKKGRPERVSSFLLVPRMHAFFSQQQALAQLWDRLDGLGAIGAGVWSATCTYLMV